MAKNTFKENTFKKDNDIKKPGPSVASATVAAPKAPRRKWFAFLADRRFHLTGGFFLIFISLFLAVSFVSYLFTGKADQSIVDSVFDATVRESGAEVENWMRLTGAVISHLFIFRWFGIASFLFIPVFFFAGYKIVFRRELFPIATLTSFSVFSILWISLLLGYVILVSHEESFLGFLSGGIGYEFALMMDSLIGWGTLLFIAFSLIVFIIFFFDVTSIKGFNTKINEKIKDIEEAHKEEVDFTPSPKVVEKEAEPAFVKSPVTGEERILSPTVMAMKDTRTEVSLSPAVSTSQHTSYTNGSAANSKKQGGVEFSIEERHEEPELEIAPVVEEEESNTNYAQVFGNYDPTLDLPNYQYPPIELLNEYQTDKVQVSVEELEANKDRIVETLANYSIGIASIKATIGPTVTLYEIIPEAGVRISKIKNLEDDIALSLSALGIRIIAPIPGKGTIGIEVPNKNREMVSMRSVLATDKFMKSSMELPVVLGKTIANELFMTDLAKMPHLLMAGATGQGKSVGLNVILTSLIYKKHPSQLKFVLVDPKKVELTLFNKIERHFLAMLPDGAEPIITDTKKVVNTLNSLCIEMDMRYDLLKDAGCRNLKEYNHKFIERRLNPEKGHRFMPYIVLVIDELADLMMTAGKEVEQPIARLAQLARAIGIHLVVATQRPSVNVITGIIKANFPARLSFKVTSKIDSRTILDTGGADQLVGQGDMLLSTGSDIIRLQCAFVDTPEVDRICDFIGNQRGYDSAYILPEYEGDESGEEKSEFDPANRDPLFEDAARVIVTHQQGSTSLLQRRLKLGYNRAGRLIDQLESAGVVGPFEGSKAREVLIPDENSLEQLLNKLNNN
jgi:S-DNA-T family DNA segregation ATPase FtsK/SpoIIIE